MIDDGSRGWHDWYLLNWGHPPLWTATTRKLKDAKWRGPDGAKLRVRNQIPDGQYARDPVQLQRVGAFAPGKPAVDYTVVKELKGSPGLADRVRQPEGTGRHRSQNHGAAGQLAVGHRVQHLPQRRNRQRRPEGESGWQAVAGPPGNPQPAVGRRRICAESSCRQVRSACRLPLMAGPPHAGARPMAWNCSRLRNAGPGFYLKAPDAAPVRLTKLSLQPDGRLSARSEMARRRSCFE